MIKKFRRMLSVFLVASVFILIACSDNNSTANNKIILEVNDFKMTQKEFETICFDDIAYKNDYKTSSSRKRDLMDAIIRKELLIQHAKNRGLDKNNEFMAAIEKYWEATLIKLLLEKKSTEIQKRTSVSEQEIKNKYSEYKAKNKNLPELQIIEKEIATEILETKKTIALDKWIKSLHEKADIKIDESILSH